MLVRFVTGIGTGQALIVQNRAHSRCPVGERVTSGAPEAVDGMNALVTLLPG